MHSQVQVAHQQYQDARYERVVHRLPQLLGAVETARRTTPPRQRHEWLMSCVSAYAVTAKLLTKMGAGDLAPLAADRCATAAVEAGSVLARGWAAYQVVCALGRSARLADAEHPAVTVAEALHPRPDDAALVPVTGSLRLVAAVIAARRADRGEAQRLDTADGPRCSWTWPGRTPKAGATRTRCCT